MLSSVHIFLNVIMIKWNGMSISTEIHSEKIWKIYGTQTWIVLFKMLFLDF